MKTIYKVYICKTMIQTMRLYLETKRYVEGNVEVRHMVYTYREVD